MKALLICPVVRPAVAVLAEEMPLAAIPLLGASLVEYWLVHLAMLGARQVTILAADRVEQIRQIVADGARWGLQVEVHAEPAESECDEARGHHLMRGTDVWLPPPDNVVLMDHLPGLPEHGVFENYAAWFVTAQTWMVRALTPVRVGVREIQPGVRVGLHSRVGRGVQFIPPCWIGENVYLGAGARLGPIAVVEDGAYIEPGAEIARSIIGPDTFVGGHAEIRDSIAWGDTLINWRTESCVRVPDPFLLGPLRTTPSLFSPGDWLRRWRQSGRAAFFSAAPAGNTPALPSATSNKN